MRFRQSKMNFGAYIYSLYLSSSYVLHHHGGEANADDFLGTLRNAPFGQFFALVYEESSPEPSAQPKKFALT
jgi:hypothetical protein